jgi:hypothetical protein
MITTALAHAHATLHIHPEAVAIAAVCLAASVAAWKVVSAIRRARSNTR